MEMMACASVVVMKNPDYVEDVLKPLAAVYLMMLGGNHDRTGRILCRRHNRLPRLFGIPSSCPFDNQGQMPQDEHGRTFPNV